jgi:ribonuclease Z
MADLIVLGTAASVPDAEHDTVSLALRGPDWAVLVDCGGSPLHKLARFGVKPEQIQAVILTHSHADHIYGLPMLVQGLWLNDRDEPLPIYGPGETIDLARRLLELFNLAEREGMFPIEWRTISQGKGTHVLETGGVQVRATPVEHGTKDTRALRFDNAVTGRSIVYSADTRPCETLIDLAAGADLLIHEATGEFDNHTSPAQAAEVAREAGVAELALIHYPVRGENLERMHLEAAGFPGPVLLAQDGEIYPI